MNAGANANPNVHDTTVNNINTVITDTIVNNDSAMRDNHDDHLNAELNKKSICKLLYV